MKLILATKTVAIALFTGVGAASVAAQSLMLDFGQTPVATPYLTLSPGHNTGTIGLSDTSWNTINSSAVFSALVYSDGLAASGITLSLGQEATIGNHIIDFSTPIANLGLVGTGGGIAGQASLLGAGSIYGDNTASTAAGRDGVFGGGSGAAGAAIGLRLDGISAGDYVVYVMARNVNSNGPEVPMNIFATTGSASGTFNFSALSASLQSNIGYPSATYAGEYTTFIDGENYVAISLSLGSGESLFLAVDGAGVESRGFLNSFQIAPAPVPEPSSLALAGLFGLVGLLYRRSK